MQKMLVVGIDLGTTYSCVAVWKDGKIETIKNSDNERTTPSFVTFNKNGERQIGREAKNKSSKDPSNTVYDVKRLIGRKFHERQVKKDMEQWPFTVVDRDNIPMIQVLGKEEFKPEVISSMVLKKLKETVEERYDKKVEKAVITVPAYFNNAQRQATKVAGELAGLSVLRILNEPTAAALAYGINCDINSKKTVLIFDMGGGTTDVTVLTITKNEKKKFKVLSTAGDIHLGGEDFDKKIVDYICQDIKEKYKKDIKDNRKILRNLRSTTKESNEQEIEKKIKDNLKVLTQIKIAAVRAKEKLSNSTEIEIEIDGAFINNDEDYSKILSRTKFEALCDNLFNYAMKPVKKAIRNAGIDKKQIDEIVLVGGSTRIPKIQSMLKQYFGCKHLYKNIDPDEAVAHGAAIQAAMLLDPEFSKKIDLIDVTTHCLGTSISNGNDERKKMSVIIKKSTEIPCEKSDIFHTCNDNQTSITVDIWEGDGEYIEDNNLLGDYELTGLEPAPAGDKRVEISFKIDANGILDVTAKEIGAGECNSITVSNVKISTSHLEMKKLSENLQKYDDLDREKKKKIEVRHQLQEYIASLKALVDEKNSDLEEDECKKMRKMIDETTIWLKKVELTADRETLENKLNKMKEFFAPIFNERQTKRIIAKNDLLAHARTMKSAVEESSKIMIDICDKSIEEFENSPLVNTEQYECKLNKARSMLKLFVEKKHSDVIEKRGELLAIVLKLKQLVQEDFCKLSKDQKDFIIKTCDETMVWWDLTDFSTKIEKYDEKIHEVLNTWFSLKNEKRKYNSTIQKQSFKKQKLKDCVVLLENKKT